MTLGSAFANSRAANRGLWRGTVPKLCNLWTMRWFDAALSDVVRRQVERDSAVAREVTDLKAEIERLRAEAGKDRFWTHIGVEATLIALGISWWTPKQTSLGVLEGAIVFIISGIALSVTMIRKLLIPAQPARLRRD